MINSVLVEKCDLVIDDNKNNKTNNIIRKLGNKLIKYIVSKIVKDDVKDVLSGYRALSDLNQMVFK